MKKFVCVIISVSLSFVIFVASFFVKRDGIDVSIIPQNTLSTVIIDAGHGGFDGGAVAADGTVEKDINLSIALYLQEYLSVFNINTVMIRETDCSVEDEGLDTIRQKKSSDLHNRMKIMDETDNSIYISIHQNKYQDSQYSGAQVFYSPKTKDESQVLAQCVQDCVVNTLQKENKRQIKECGTSVFLMYNAVKPAILVECGFLSNVEERNKLKTKEYQKKIAFCIAMGIQNYLTSRNE